MDGMSVKPTSMTAKNIRSLKSGQKPERGGLKQHKSFSALVRAFYKVHARGLPWRKTKNPYRILVSEIMLQQTQVDRVIPKYKAFLKKFPTVRALADASLGDVLREWQGLGYNRRAKMLHEAAKEVVVKYDGKIPRTYIDLLNLRGVGEYTAKAVRVFAWNEPEVMIETNIRSVFIHHFFPNKVVVSDEDLHPYMGEFLDKKNSREWYAALMDYGSYLKKTFPNPSRKSVHHTRQKPFKGSDREIRGALLRELSKKPLTPKELDMLPFQNRRISAQLKRLIQEGFVTLRKFKYALSD
ncbi:MAG: A/G-specific adenine glycosylase [Patescibacteria group bacterium]